MYILALHTPRCYVHLGATYTPVLHTPQLQPGNNRDARGEESPGQPTHGKRWGQGQQLEKSAAGSQNSPLVGLCDPGTETGLPLHRLAWHGLGTPTLQDMLWLGHSPTALSAFGIAPLPALASVNH